MIKDTWFRATNLRAVVRLTDGMTRWGMARGYSRDLRERLLHALASGVSAAEIARMTGVSPSSLRRWKRKQATGASLVPGASPGGPRKIPTTDEPALRAQVTAMPDATLAKHSAQWLTTGHVAVSRSTMGRALDRLGLPLKKDPDRDRTR